MGESESERTRMTQTPLNYAGILLMVLVSIASSLITQLSLFCSLTVFCGILTQI